jgi:hypothetical protein
MSCLICDTWEKLGHGSRHTTPIEVSVAESFLATGYHLAYIVADGMNPDLCPKHDDQVNQLIEARRKTIEANIFPIDNHPPPAIITHREPIIPPAMPLKPKFPCPTCRKLISSGEVHSCSSGP